MGDSEKTSSRNKRVIFFVGGAVIGALFGWLIKNVLLGSAVGMALGVVVGTRLTEEEGKVGTGGHA
jgi:F0F1-type ATP synthase assembly protein I